LGGKCVTLEVVGARQRGRPRKTWKEVVINGWKGLEGTGRTV